MEKEIPLKNPYFSLQANISGLKPETYYGSRQTLRQVMEIISAPSTNAVELVSLPGMGRSTLLRYLIKPNGALSEYAQWLQNPYNEEPQRIFPVLVNMRYLPTELSPFAYIYQRFREEYPIYIERSESTLEDEIPELESSERVSKNGEAIRLLERDLTELSRSPIRTVFLLDDYDIVFSGMTVEETNLLRPLRDLSSFVFCTEKPLNEVNPEAAGTPFFQTMTILHLKGLEKDEAMRLLREPAVQAGCPFPAEDLDFLLEQTGTHTYLLILAGRNLWEMRKQLGLLENSSTPLTPPQQKVLSVRLLTEFERSFKVYLKNISPAETRALAALIAEQHTPVLETRHLVGLSALEQKGLVRYEMQGGYRIFSALFVEALRSTISPPEEAPAEAQPKARSRLKLSGFETNLYEYLKQQPERISSFEELWQEVWHKELPEDAEQIRRPIQVTMSRLRKKLLESTGEDIISIRDKGYRLSLPAAAGSNSQE